MNTGKSFVKLTCNQLFQEYEKYPEKLVVVLPAKRSVRFFTNNYTELLKEKNKASVLPQFITLSDLIDKISPLVRISITEAIFYFYEVYKKIENESENFERFYIWAGTLLNDFNEIDNYLTDVKLFYSDLKNIKEIEEWSFNNDELSRGQIQFNTLWIKLYSYYQELNKFLFDHGIGYNGAIMRKIAESPESYFQTKINYSYIFVGFNAFTECEKRIVTYLIQSGNGKVIFDLDKYYFDDEGQEAGLFLRKYRQHFNRNFNAIDADSLENDNKQISYYECSGEIIQTFKLNEQIEKLNGNYGSTAIVLCNEKLLPVVINHLPNNLNQINVTMGWSLAYTSINDFIHALIDFHSLRKRDRKFLPIRVVRNLMHQTKLIFQKFTGGDTESTNIDTIKAVFEQNNLLELLTEHTIGSFIKAVVTIFTDLAEQESTTAFNREIFIQFIVTFNKLVMLPGFYELVNSWSVFKGLLGKYSTSNPIAFVGEPFSGIQILGMLETRGIDFENVFVLSANEGILPAHKPPKTLIPFDLKEFYKLPGKREHDAIYAYYFYRLIQRAKNIHIFYNSQSETLGQAEKSRYLLQLEKELLVKNSSIVFSKIIVDSSVKDIPSDFVIKKSGFYFQRIKEIFENGVSASMLDKYVNCTLDFYYRYILGIKVDENEDEFSAADLGTLTHGFFNQIFKDHINQFIDNKLLEYAINNIEQIMKNVAHQIFPGKDFGYGEAFLGIEMAKKMILRLLKNNFDGKLQNGFLGKKIIGTEMEMISSYNVCDTKLYLKGNIDLLLCDTNNDYHVYDFKTGNTKKENLINKKLNFDEGEGLKAAENKLMCQLLIYEELVAKKYRSNSIQSYIIPMATGSSEIYLMEGNMTEKKNALKIILKDFIQSINDTKVDIVHNKKYKYCDLC